MPTLYTIGHSSHPIAEFLAILDAHKINKIVDVRSIPKSRHVPWFNEKSLQTTLRKNKIAYVHMPELGGLRHTHKDSINTAWQNASFRGYADYMQTKEFFEGLKQLNSFLRQRQRVAVMCAEAVPWRCHRSLIADAEIIRHINVAHILSKTNLREHQLTSFANIAKNTRPIKVYYPL